MSDLDNDGLVVQEDWKSKYEALLKDKKLFEERLEERVTCPVCLEVPTHGPMYSCANGHLVCASSVIRDHNLTVPCAEPR